MVNRSDDHTRWLEARMREARAIVPGKRVRDLLEVFREDGGLQQIPPRRFVLRSCSCIKIEVEYEDMGSPDANEALAPERRLTSVSRPYLELEAMD